MPLTRITVFHAIQALLGYRITTESMRPAVAAVAAGAGQPVYHHA